MAAAQDARQLLSHLLSKLKDPESSQHSRYGPWIQKNGKAELEEALFGRLRPEVLHFLQLARCESVTAMKNIGGNLNFEGRAVYLHGVLGLDRRTRIYVGQSGSLRARLKQHWNFRHRRDNPSLHYHAMQNSIYDVFAVLATLPVLLEIPGMDRPDLFLNVLETWCCLLFRSLPPQVIAEYIPLGAVEEKENESGALNIANPLDHGGDSTWECPHLKESRDPLVLDYVRELERKATPDIQFVEVKATPEICYVEIEKPAPPGVQPATLLFIGAAAFAGFMLFRRISGPK